MNRSDPKVSATATALVFAYHDFGVEGLAALERCGVRIVRVLTHADSATEIRWWRSVQEWAAERGIPVELDADLKDPAVRATLAADVPDFLFSFYFRRMIPEVVLGYARRGAYNLHGSLLPRYRGRSPVNWQLVHGERRSGLTLHRMVRQADAGDIVAQVAVDVHPDQDALGLTRQLLAEAPALLDAAIRGLVAGTICEHAQDHRHATYFGGRSPADGRIDFRWSARRIHDLVRAVAPPWPGARCQLGGQILQVWRTAIIADDGELGQPGEVLNDGSVACGQGALLLRQVVDEQQNPVALRSGDHLM